MIHPDIYSWAITKGERIKIRVLPALPANRPGCQVNKRCVLGGILLHPALDWFSKSLTLKRQGLFPTSAPDLRLCYQVSGLIAHWECVCKCPCSFWYQMGRQQWHLCWRDQLQLVARKTMFPHRWVIYWGCQQLVASGQPRQAEGVSSDWLWCWLCVTRASHLASAARCLICKIKGIRA